MIPSIYILSQIESRKFDPDTNTIWYQSEIDNQIYKSLAPFDAISDELEKKLEFHNQQIEQTIEYVDKQIENDQLSIFGITMNFDLINQALTFLVGTLVGIIQQEISSESE